MSARIRYRVDPAYLAGANLGIDPEASADRFAAELRAGLATELADFHEVPAAAEAPVDIVRGRPHGCEVEGFAVEDASRVALRVEGVARAVRACGSWIVYR